MEFHGQQYICICTVCAYQEKAFCIHRLPNECDACSNATHSVECDRVYSSCSLTCFVVSCCVRFKQICMNQSTSKLEKTTAACEFRMRIRRYVAVLKFTPIHTYTHVDAFPRTGAKILFGCVMQRMIESVTSYHQ